MIIRIDYDSIPAMLGALFVFGFGYNLLVDFVKRRRYDEGYTALLVVAGVLITVLGIGLLSIECAALVLGAFSCSGFWMVLGSMWRHARKRERSQQAIINEAKRLAE